jgi:hypothetical protein
LSSRAAVTSQNEEGARLHSVRVGAEPFVRTHTSRPNALLQLRSVDAIAVFATVDAQKFFSLAIALSKKKRGELRKLRFQLPQ